MSYSALPYFPVIIDASLGDFKYAADQCMRSHTMGQRAELVQTLTKIWMSEANANSVLPSLSVRSGFDLFLQAKRFPRGSEVIMSAVNIPDMGRIVQSHGLSIVPLDISIDSLEPKIESLPSLISPKTVAIVVAHLCGRWIDMDPIISAARMYGLTVVEDCAECFCGFDHLGHPESDISLFSFGTIKFSTSFGGCIAKVRDSEVFQTMSSLQNNYPVQTPSMYLKKVLKLAVLYTWMQVKPFPQVGREVLCRLGVDYKAKFVKMMRGFPDKMLESIRCQPSSALLATMAYRHQNFTRSNFDLQRLKGEYFLSRLPAGFEKVGHSAEINNFWLFPVLTVSFPVFYWNYHLINHWGKRLLTKTLYFLKIILQDSAAVNKRYPHEAKYMIDHVLYLPVNKRVPFKDLDKMLKACELAFALSRQPDRKSGGELKLQLKSKL
ncbi:uncharacterized protein LOC101852445 [Aplysia californica]|uniref:Uncharacterized protein LOC101852445 n=1 Tax=Aplysia californica TaxID=6500 RepID=A0ABM1W3E9_APLCA|nr:uncharacterized protein LOC101852445 [Aplysia californica]